MNKFLEIEVWIQGWASFDNRVRLQYNFRLSNISYVLYRLKWSHTVLFTSPATHSDSQKFLELTFYFRCWKKCSKCQQILVNLDLNMLPKFQNNNWMSTQQSLSHPGSKKPNNQSKRPKFSLKIWTLRRYRHLFRSFSCQNTLFNLFCFI